MKSNFVSRFAAVLLWLTGAPPTMTFTRSRMPLTRS